MAANTLPIVVKTPKITLGGIISRTANTAVDGTGTVTTAFVADATNGSFVQHLKFKPELHNTATTATSLRVFINNGLTNATPANNIFFESITLPATTESASTGQNAVILPVNLALPAGYKLNCCLATTATSASWYVSGVGGDF